MHVVKPRMLVAAFVHAVLGALAAPQAEGGSSSSLTSSVVSVSINTGVPSITFITSVASPTAALSSTLPTQAALPPVQAWCPSEIFCAGQLLQTVNIAELWADPKTFVDKPTNGSSQQVLSAFSDILGKDGNSTSNVTEGQMLNFVDTNFKGEGLELEALALPNFNPNPAFLQNVTDPLVRAFAQTVHGFWTQLTRATNSSTLCPEGSNNGPCESTLIPLNHTFVIPGGRFREQYYWDTYWIIEGLLESELYSTANSSLQNFMDELEKFGFIPNGGRIYYLNRSQPPLFVHMLSNYIQATNDISILARALPLAETELAWWQNNRTVNVTSSYSNQSYTVYRYNVNNTAPRPESYITDYLTINDPVLGSLEGDAAAELYAELATGAEAGWDYTTRFASNPTAGGSNNTNPILRSYNIINTAPVDLNSILYNAHNSLADLYLLSSSSNATASSQADSHRSQAATLKTAILDLFWDSDKVAFYDYNLTSDSRNAHWSPATFYPIWNGIIPSQILENETVAWGFFSSINMVLNRYNGTVPASFIASGLQWDAPNAWPPHQYIALSALSNLPSNITTLSIPTPKSGQTTYDLVPSGQLNLSSSQLPGQPLISGGNASVGADINALNGTVSFGGNASAGENWSQALQRELANRYLTSVLCSWRSTGGSIQGFFDQYNASVLNETGSIGNNGNMYEKFDLFDIDAAGYGGEYMVQAGFGWTNGILLWVAANYGKVLVGPACPQPTLLVISSISNGSSSGSSKSAALSSRSNSSAYILAVAVGVSLSLLFC